MLTDLWDNLVHKDWFMTLLDFEATVKQSSVYWMIMRTVKDWMRMALVNTAKAGFFSSDRTIRDYNKDIWHLK
jgi:starch phosphorylase